MPLGVVIAAAGSGRRMGAEGNKVLLSLKGKAIVLHSLQLFASLPEVREIVLTAGQQDLEAMENLIAGLNSEKQIQVVQGGRSRQESVYRGLRGLSSDLRWVIIHDGARPYCSAELVYRTLQACYEHQAAGAAVPVKDTIKVVEQGVIVRTPERSKLWAMQTPQVFSYPLIRNAHEKAAREGIEATDDCGLLEAIGHPVHIVPGEYGNIKITTPEDLPGDERVLVGFGSDVHRFAAGRPLVLGGVKIPYERGLLGHSDADVVIHALMDALLGAAGAGDIGEHFPDTDPRYKGISSLELLKKTGAVLREKGLVINNADLTIMAQEPKISPWKGQMQAVLAKTLEIEVGRVNIKATTMEGLGFVGRKEGIAAQAVVSLGFRQ